MLANTDKALMIFTWTKFLLVRFTCIPRLVVFMKQANCVRSKRESLKWRHNEHHGVPNHRGLHCLLSCCFRRKSKKASKLCVTGLCEENSPVTGAFPAQRASGAENVSIWWRHHVYSRFVCCFLCGYIIISWWINVIYIPMFLRDLFLAPGQS